MRVDRMIGAGAGRIEDASLPSRIGDTAADLFGKLVHRHVMRAGGGEQQPARCDKGRRQSGELAIAARSGLEVAPRLHKSRRIGDDDVEQRVLGGQLFGLDKDIPPAERAAPVKAVGGC